MGVSGIPSQRRRLDLELLARGLADSRQRAQALVAGGQVLVGGAPASSPGRLVGRGEAIEVEGPPPRFVSRGGGKLEGALGRLGIEVKGRRALDAGASTGGFTDCLLQRGGASVIALDVGRGLLHHRLRSDPRVVVVERTNVREATLATVGGQPVDVVTADLSFISLTLVAPVLAGPLAGPGADVVVLVKPQFEVGRAEATRGRGVVRNPASWRACLERVGSAFEEAGAAMIGAVPSPITGTDGNVEFFLHLRAHAREVGRRAPVDLDLVVGQAVASFRP
jgi:23S rRNA (cytidine1920-2'-O)/16S rRNA (cytidine1409-2'-O)-methyltransferase